MFMALSEANDVIEVGSSKIYLFDVPAEAITGVVFGARASMQLQQAIRATVKDRNDLQHIKVRSCHPDPTEFVLRVRESGI